MVLTMAERKDNQPCSVRLLPRAKSNIGPDTGGFEYILHEAELPQHPGIRALSEEHSSQARRGSCCRQRSRRSMRMTVAPYRRPSSSCATSCPTAPWQDGQARGRQSWALVVVDPPRKTGLGVDVRKSGMESPWVWPLPRVKATRPNMLKRSRRRSTLQPEHLRRS